MQGKDFQPLRECPFCGGEAAARDIKEPFVNGWVGCQRCRCFMDFVKNGKPLAIAAWNRRAEQNNTPLALDEIISRCTPKAAELLKNGLLGAVKVCAVEEITPKTNADRIRSMSDEELAVWILRSVDCDKENIMCIPALYKNSDKCGGRCRDGRLSWLQQPAKEEYYE